MQDLSILYDAVDRKYCTVVYRILKGIVQEATTYTDGQLR